MRKILLSVVTGVLCLGAATDARAANYVEYYRDNLFLSLAYHRVACLTDGTKILSSQDYDGFTTKRYCVSGATAKSVPDGEWYFRNTATGKAQLDSCGLKSNTYYGTANYAARSTTCSYNILTNCNSDCWIRRFSICQGKQVATASPGCF